MKSASVAMENHLQGETTTLATLWRLTREDGQVFGFTDHDVDITFESLLYKAATGYTPSTVDTASDLSVDNLEVESILDSDTITDEDVRAGLWDYCAVDIWQVNYADLSMGKIWLRRGRLGEIKTGRGSFSAELRGLMQNLQQTVGRIYSPLCDANLGDVRCGVDLSTYTYTGTVTTVVSRRTFSSTIAQPDDTFVYGLLTFTGGLNEGLAMEVKTYVAGQFTLQQSIAYDVSPGDTFNVYFGCDKIRSTCKNKFNNVVNFRGFPDVPLRDRIISGKS